VFFFYKIRYVPSYHKVFVSTLAILFYETHLDQLPYSVFQLRVKNSCVEGREVRYIKAIAGVVGCVFYGYYRSSGLCNLRLLQEYWVVYFTAITGVVGCVF